MDALTGLEALNAVRARVALERGHAIAKRTVAHIGWDEGVEPWLLLIHSYGSTRFRPVAFYFGPISGYSAEDTLASYSAAENLVDFFAFTSQVAKKVLFYAANVRRQIVVPDAETLARMAHLGRGMSRPFPASTGLSEQDDKMVAQAGLLLQEWARMMETPGQSQVVNLAEQLQQHFVYPAMGPLQDELGVLVGHLRDNSAEATLECVRKAEDSFAPLYDETLLEDFGANTHIAQGLSPRKNRDALGALREAMLDYVEDSLESTDYLSADPMDTATWARLWTDAVHSHLGYLASQTTEAMAALASLGDVAPSLAKRREMDQNTMNERCSWALSANPFLGLSETPAQAAVRKDFMEGRLSQLFEESAFDDPEVMMERVLANQAYHGVVTGFEIAEEGTKAARLRLTLSSKRYKAFDIGTMLREHWVKGSVRWRVEDCYLGDGEEDSVELVISAPAKRAADVGNKVGQTMTLLENATIMPPREYPRDSWTHRENRQHQQVQQENKALPTAEEQL